MTMTHNSSSISDIDEIEFTAAYGTAIAMTGKRQPAACSHQPETLAEAPEMSALEGK